MNKFGWYPVTSLNWGSAVISPVKYQSGTSNDENQCLAFQMYTSSIWKVIECRNKSHVHVQNTPAVFFISVFWVVMDKTLTPVHRLLYFNGLPKWITLKWTTPKNNIPNEY